MACSASFVHASPSTSTCNCRIRSYSICPPESEKKVERLQKQEENMLQEVKQKAKDLHVKEFKLPHQKPIPCLDERDACVKCYKEHEKNPLNCANVVLNYRECARRAKQQVSQADK